MTDIGLLKVSGGHFPQPQSARALSTYQVGQRTVQLFQRADGHVQWVCNCEDYAASAGSAHGAWCKHVAKASAIRSIERLTGARVIARSRATPAAQHPEKNASHPDLGPSVQALSQSH